MREIKFRAWDKNKKEWIGDDGTTFTSENPTEGVVALTLDGHLRVFYPSCIDPITEDDEPLHAVAHSEYESVHPCHTKSSYKRQYILCQYTGLKDKNDKEIYEGDIVKQEEEIGEVSWIYNKWQIVLRRTKIGIEIGRSFGDGELREGQFTEVIGNIYENPNLLKNDNS